MTTKVEIPTPELNSPQGKYGDTRVTHVKNLLARASVAGSATELSPEIIRKMRRHYQVASCLLVQSLPLIRADWSIECEDEAIRDRLTEWYRGISFHLHRSMARALWAGYSPNEVVWDYFEDLKLTAITQVRDLEPRTCKPAVDDTGELDGMVQQSGGDTIDFEPLYTLWIVEGLESGDYYGRSLLDAALDPWADYAAIRAFHARYLERFGEPVVVCRAPEGTSIVNLAEITAAIELNDQNEVSEGDPGYTAVPSPVVVDNLDTALDTGQNLRHHSVVALPSKLLFGTDGKPNGFAWQLEFLEAKGGSGDDFLNALRETDKRIGRAMFVPDLLSQNTEDVGSNALGQTHKSVWEESVEGRLDDYSRQITAQTIDPVRILNFGVNSAAARLVFSPLSDEEQDRQWALVVELVTQGKLPLDAKELADRYDLPLDEAALAAGPADPPPAAGEQDLRRNEAILDLVYALAHRGDAHALTAGGEPDTGSLPEWKLPQSLDPPARWRELNAREKRVGLTKIEDGLNRVERQTIAALGEVLDTEHDRVLRQLGAIVKKGTPAEILDALGTIQIKSSPKVADAWRSLMGDVGGLVVEQLRGELAAYAEQLPERITANERALFRAYAETAAERVTASLLTETRLSLLNAFTSGVSTKAGLASIVGQTFDAYSSNESKPVRLTTRMLSAKAMNYSRAAQVEAGGIPLAGAQYSAILDLRVCELCRKLDEKVIPIEHTDLGRFTPPVHHNCRCLWIWITRDEADFTPTWTTPSKSDVDRYGGLVI